MPRYDFECPHQHRFEHDCPMADRGKLIPCEGKVPRLLTDEEVELAEAGEMPEARLTNIGPEGEQEVWVRDVPCILKAKQVVGTHSNPKAMLDHGMASNRDAAREGRYDPMNPSRRFMAKGRGWRK